MKWLVALGGWAESARPSIVETLEDTDRDVRQLAKAALGVLAEQSDDAGNVPAKPTQLLILPSF